MYTHKSFKCRHGDWEETFLGMSKCWDFKGGMLTSCVSPTRLREMVSSVMPFVTLRTHGHSTSGTSQHLRNGYMMGIRHYIPESLGCSTSCENKHHNCLFDNLYLSAKFAKASYKHDNKVQISGPMQKSGRGLPKCVLQEEKTSPSEFHAV